MIKFVLCVEYDYKCKTAYPGFIRTFVETLGACYYFSSYQTSMVNAINTCDWLNSRVLVFVSELERKLIVKTLKEWYQDQFIMWRTGYKWWRSDRAWHDYYTGKTDLELGYSAFFVRLERDKYMGKEGDCAVGQVRHNMNQFSLTCDTYDARFICKRFVPTG